MTVNVNAPRRLSTRLTTRVEIEFNQSGNFVKMVDENDTYITGELRLSRDAFWAIGRDLLQAWQNEVGFTKLSTPLQTTVPQERSAADEQLVTFAAAGNFALHELLDSIEEPVRGLLGTTLEAFVDPATESPILAFLCKVVFPWRMLFVAAGGVDDWVTDETPASAISASGFLGNSGPVDHMSAIANPPEPGPGRTAPIGIHPGLKKLVGGNADIQSLFQGFDILPKVTQNERSLAKTIADDESILIYMFCHGQFRPATAGLPVQDIVLRPNKVLTSSELGRRLRVRLGKDGLFSTSPVVFLNACQAGVIGAAEDNSIASILRRHGAQCTVAPLIDMPVCFGGPFGKEVIRLLVERRSASDALLSATRLFVETGGNLLGLAYCTVDGRNAQISV